MSILITGGAGYIGSHTCVELLNAGRDIVVLDNFANASKACPQRVKALCNVDFPVYEADILDRDAVRRIFKAHEIESVIHFAGLKAVGESVRLPLQYYHNNVAGTISLCQTMAEFGVKRLVFSSSATVYGSHNKAPYVESMPTGGCTNPYGQTKYMIELILQDLFVSDPDWRISILRYFNPIGAHESGQIGEQPSGIPNNIMPYITQVAIGKLEQLSVFGSNYDTVDGTGVRDYIHVVDLARGHMKALSFLDAHAGVHIHNLGTGRGVSVLELVRAFEDASGQKVPYILTDRRPGDVDVCFASVEKAQAELGFATAFDIHRMCADSWRWQSQNPDGM